MKYTCLLVKAVAAAVFLCHGNGALAVVPMEYQPRYDAGFSSGRTAGYSDGFAVGEPRGVSKGTTVGQQNGHAAGWDASYQPAFDLAFDQQFLVGRETGWDQGFVAGFETGFEWVPLYLSSGAGTVMVRGNFDSSEATFMTPQPDSLKNGSGSLSGSVTYTLSSTPTAYDWGAHYFRAGYDDAYEQFFSTGSNEGYAHGYGIGYDAAYAPAFLAGEREGDLEGTRIGGAAGYDAGWELGYDSGFDLGFDSGVEFQLTGSFGPPATDSGGTLTTTNQPSAELNVSSNAVPEPASIGLIATFCVLFSVRCRR